MPHPDRERLAKMMRIQSDDCALQIADKLLAAGVTLPPAPTPRLVTEEMAREAWDAHMGSGWYRWSGHGSNMRREILDCANALAEAAIRRAVDTNTIQSGEYRGTVSLWAYRGGLVNVTPENLLAIFPGLQP